ncbi:MAG: TauD/TfdA family dioxygenase [Solirubrobacterales bacterium]
MPPASPPSSPFDLDHRDAYLAWRDRRLAGHPERLAELVVEIEDIARPSRAEAEAVMERVGRCNMALYVETAAKPGRDDKQALRSLAARFGLRSLDCNNLADDDGVTPLAVHRDGTRARYIPFTERPIAWHTDGYYNPVARRVRALLLHCARPAADGGENKLMDHEMLYIALRDEDPGLVAALMRPDAMTIPGNDEEGMERPATRGPVFYVDADGSLGMRYTARGRNVEWGAAPEVQAAAAAIRRHLDGPSPAIFQGRLEAGWGLISNNVLHTREPFADDAGQPRLLYRARYHDRIATA